MTRKKVELEPQITVPTATASESAVLGILVEAPDLIPAAVDAGLKSTDFLHETNQRIYSALLVMRQLNEAIDCISLLEYLGNSANDAGVISYSIYGVVIERSHLLTHVRIVRRKAALRQLMAISETLLAGAQQPGADPVLLADSIIGRLQVIQ